jgi:Tol biopolymer transport system component
MENSRILLFCLVSLLFHLSAFSQDLENLYFGQKRPGTTPEVFAPGFISTDAFEFSGTFSMDMREYFFTRRPDYQSNENRIYYTRLLNNEWTSPVLAPFANNTFEFEPVMSPSEPRLYFFSERSEKRDDRYDGDLWYSELTEDGWSEANYFLSPVNKKWCMSVSPSLSGTLYFSSQYDGRRGIFQSRNQQGEYPSVDYLGDELNSAAYFHPYVAPDESYMLMDGQPTGRGKSELFISFKQSDGTWSAPKNMGPAINATKTEFGASVSPDGKYMFFHRRVDGKGDIYWVDSSIISSYR